MCFNEKNSDIICFYLIYYSQVQKEGGIILVHTVQCAFKQSLNLKAIIKT